MSQTIVLEAHTTFGPMTASAVLQVRPASDVFAEPSPALKYLELMNPLRWSTNDFSRFAAFAKDLLLLLLLLLIGQFFKGNS